MLTSPRLLGALILASLLALASCGIHSSTEMDWVDFIQFHGILYLRQPITIGRALTHTDLGTQYATVKFELEGYETNPSYHRKDGDAAYLPVGTPVYAVHGYQPAFMLAAERPTVGLELYVVNSNPHANNGADLLAIGGKVRSIEILSPQDATTVVSSITQTAEVQTLVTLVLDAPVNQALTPEGTKYYFIAFQRLTISAQVS